MTPGHGHHGIDTTLPAFKGLTRSRGADDSGSRRLPLAPHPYHYLQTRHRNERLFVNMWTVSPVLPSMKIDLDLVTLRMCIVGVLTSWLSFGHAQIMSDGDSNKCAPMRVYDSHYAQNILKDWCGSYEEAIKCLNDVFQKPFTVERRGDWFASLMFHPELMRTRSRTLCEEMEKKVDNYYCDKIPGPEFIQCVRQRSMEAVLDYNINNVTIGQDEDNVRENLCKLMRGQRECYISDYKNCEPEASKIVGAVRTMTVSRCFKDEVTDNSLAPTIKTLPVLVIALWTLTSLL
ncbi:hypothetical protein ScPMuIL_008135 [Solemya velum]